jgi:L-serine dehydratase
MFLSVFEIFKIGIGPSSSHTMGPMIAAARFRDALQAADKASAPPDRLRVSLYGSLAFTGRGHATDRAVTLGLAGILPDTLDPIMASALERKIAQEGCVTVGELGVIRFDPEADLVFDYGAPLPGHPNGMIFEALDAAGAPLLRETYYSIGGGFVQSEEELEAEKNASRERPGGSVAVPFPFETARQMLEMGRVSGLSIAEMKRRNEIAVRGKDPAEGIARIWDVMNSCIARGVAADGVLPGGLNVRRRARAIHERLKAGTARNQVQPFAGTDWLQAYALAVNEENAAGGQVVTAPTNGAAGIVPAVIKYYRDHCVGATDAGIEDFILTAAAIAGLLKHNAAISGAELGCQGEVGSAAAMAAAGFCAALDGTNEQVENAAEIALEHHLGMTCDPAKGLVQIPCIERNAIGAIKAVSAASLALHGDGTHVIPLDNCIEAMRQTGEEMNTKYKETSLGGIAVNLPAC